MALSHIFNLSLSTGKVISDFKIAKIILLYKKSDVSDIKNYRTISLLSNISKIFKKIMYRRVISFLNRHNFVFENQFGFRKKCSTSQAISLLINSITNSFNKNEKRLAIFLDLSKAKKPGPLWSKRTSIYLVQELFIQQKTTSCVFWYFIVHKQFINHGFSARVYFRPTLVSYICE